jgi:hypothetical protein
MLNTRTCSIPKGQRILYCGQSEPVPCNSAKAGIIRNTVQGRRIHGTRACRDACMALIRWVLWLLTWKCLSWHHYFHSFVPRAVPFFFSTRSIEELVGRPLQVQRREMSCVRGLVPRQLQTDMDRSVRRETLSDRDSDANSTDKAAWSPHLDWSERSRVYPQWVL